MKPDMRTDVLVDSVQRVLNSFMESNPDMSVTDLSDKAMSSLTTIRGLKNGTIEHLSAKKALEISSRLGGPKTLDGLVSLSDDQKATQDAVDFQNRFSHLFPYEMQGREIESFMSDKDYARIIWAAYGATNITRDEVAHRWGQEGITRLEELLKLNILNEADGLITGNSENGGFGIDSTYRQLGIGYQLYSPLNRVNQENWVSFQTQSVSGEFLKDFRERLRSLFGEFHEKSNSSENQGNQRVFFGMLFDRYMPDLHDPKELQ
jgi:hypothetical protein